MPKKDFTQIAFDVARIATGEATQPAITTRQKNSSAGGVKGGAARAEKLSPERRAEIAKKAAQSRWAEKAK